MDEHELERLEPMPRLLAEHGRRAALKAASEEVYQKNYLKKSESRRLEGNRAPKTIWAHLKMNAVAAACVAVLTAFSTLWLSGYYKTMEKNSTNYRELRRDMNTVKQNVNEHNQVIRNMSGDRRDAKARNNFGATGFLLSTQGYVVTNHHVVLGADSVHLQNSDGQSYRARVVHVDPVSDLAVLKIEDPSFGTPAPIPYTFKSTPAELGEDVFTLGFPRDEAVYGQGYLSSKSGYKGDTTAYQISIPLNPGNSGSPLLDSRGNVIGIISGKQAGLDGASFAVKTKELLKSIEQISLDSAERPIQLNQRRSLNRLSRVEQIKRIQDYVFIVKVF